MSLDKFDYILALAEERNLTRAAKKTFISQPPSPTISTSWRASWA